MESIDNALEAWQESPEDISPVAQLQRDLHTLKGGARMTDLNHIADLCHELETLYEYICAGRLGVPDTIFNVLDRAHDALMAQLQNVRNGFEPNAATALVKEINALTNATSDTSALDNLARSEEHTSELQSRPHL